MRADDLILRASRYAASGADKLRYDELREFCRGCKTILSVGSAGYEPVLIGATHALDVKALAGELLKSAGWTGEFVVGTCTKLPFADKSFECGVCSEVIEHLPSIDDVEASLNELNRVCNRWVVTTPTVSVPEPDHKFLFLKDQIQMWCAKYGAVSEVKGIWWFIKKGCD